MTVPAPKACEYTISRHRPVIREIRVVRPTTEVLLKMARLMGRPHYTGAGAAAR